MLNTLYLSRSRRFCPAIASFASKIFWTIFINIISGIGIALILNYFKVYGAIIAFIFLIWIYHEGFRLKWFKALIAWALQFVMTFVIGLVFLFILVITGIAVNMASLL